MLIFWRRWADSNRRIRVLQTRALPLGYNAVFIITLLPYTVAVTRSARTPTATWLQRPIKVWSGKRGSNPRPLPWQGSALSTELFPRFLIKYIHI